MTRRLRSRWLAGGGALLLLLAVSGGALGADLAGETSAPPRDEGAPTVVEAATVFVDVDGDGIDDQCDPSVVADPVAAAAAEAAADLDGDGTISVSEAARSGRVGGKNCNHGGYVSGVAQGQCAADESAPAATDQGDSTDGTDTPVVTLASDPADEDHQGETEEAEDAPDAPDAGPCTEDATTTTPEAETQTPCVPVAAPPFDPTLLTGPGAFGAYVSSVAKSDAVGGKNCNHGGAVSDAVHAAKAAAKEARDAAKAERKAGRDAAKAGREAAKASHGKGKGAGN